MRKILALLALICGSLIAISPNASATVADCVILGAPSVSSTDTSISVQVTLNVNCTTAQLGNNGGSPRYSIVEETSTTSSCSGPESLRAGLVSSVRCTIRMGTSTGSTRTGEKSSTLRVTYRSDSSSTSVGFNHVAILQNTQGEGSTSLCKVAPSAPRLSVTYSDANLGPRFEFSDDPNSDVATALLWTYSTYDSVKKSWDAWNNLTSEALVKGHGNFVFQSNLIANKSRIAFYVYASGKCGVSPKTRESNDENGIPLAGRVQNYASLKVSQISILDFSALIDLIEVASNNDFAAVSKTPGICLISGGKLAPVSIGNCVLSINANSNYNVTALIDFSLVIPITRSAQALSNAVYKSVSIGSNIALPDKTDQGLALIPEISSTDVCVLDINNVIAKAIGNCTGTLKNSGNDKYSPFEVAFSVQVTKLSQTIKVANLASGLIIKNKVAKLAVSATSKLPVTANNLTPKVCNYNNGSLQIVSNGLCNFELIQAGDAMFSPAPKISIKMNISNSQAKLTITCAKGNLVKQVSGTNPVCPAGFKKK